MHVTTLKSPCVRCRDLCRPNLRAQKGSWPPLSYIRTYMSISASGCACAPPNSSVSCLLGATAARNGSSCFEACCGWELGKLLNHKTGAGQGAVCVWGGNSVNWLLIHKHLFDPAGA